jgi:hypothetical protein
MEGLYLDNIEVDSAILLRSLIIEMGVAHYEAVMEGRKGDEHVTAVRMVDRC